MARGVWRRVAHGELRVLSWSASCGQSPPLLGFTHKLGSHDASDFMFHAAISFNGLHVPALANQAPFGQYAQTERDVLLLMRRQTPRQQPTPLLIHRQNYQYTLSIHNQTSTLPKIAFTGRRLAGLCVMRSRSSARFACQVWQQIIGQGQRQGQGRMIP